MTKTTATPAHLCTVPGFVRLIPGARNRVRRIAVPESARALITLPRVDYEDAFTLEVGEAPKLTGEEWARVTLESASGPKQRALLGLLSAIGMQFGPMRSERFVLGWEIQRSSQEFALLGASSPRIGLTAQLLFRCEQGTLLFATFLRLETPVARALWAVLSRLHRQVVPYLLAQTDRRIAEGTQSAA